MEQSSANRAWTALAILLMFNILGYIDRSIVSLLVQPMKADLLLSDVQIGLVQGFAFAIFYALFGLPIGWALDRFPKRPIVFAGITLWSLASAACGLARSFEELLVARLFVGIGEATLVPASFAILAGLFRRDQLARALSIFNIATAVGMVIAMLGGGALIEIMNRRAAIDPDTMAAWRMVLIVTGLPGVALAVLIFAVREPHSETPVVTGDPQSDGFWQFLKSRRAFLITHNLGLSLLALTAMAVTSWLPTYLIRNHGWNAGEAASALALTTVFSVISTLAAGFLADWLFARGRTNAHMVLMAWAGVLATILTAGAFYFVSDQPWTLLVIVGLGMACTSTMGVGVSALQLVTPPAYRARISAIYLVQFAMLANGAGPLVTAFLTDYVFRDEAALHHSMMTAMLIFGPISIVLLVFAARMMTGLMAQISTEKQAA